jgi:hypothetical protein
MLFRHSSCVHICLQNISYLCTSVITGSLGKSGFISIAAYCIQKLRKIFNSFQLYKKQPNPFLPGKKHIAVGQISAVYNFKQELFPNKNREK